MWMASIALNEKLFYTRPLCFEQSPVDINQDQCLSHHPRQMQRLYWVFGSLVFFLARDQISVKLFTLSDFLCENFETTLAKCPLAIHTDSDPLSTFGEIGIYRFYQGRQNYFNRNQKPHIWTHYSFCHKQIFSWNTTGRTIYDYSAINDRCRWSLIRA